MRIGYPCINRSIGCKGDCTFRLASYSEERLYATVAGNLECLQKILAWNQDHRILFFRITSDLVPFASHSVCISPWQDQFRDELAATGRFIRSHEIRISMHPDQFIVLNARNEGIVERSIAELGYHAKVLDLMGLDTTAKIQLHIGGVYGNREESLNRFIRVYGGLDHAIIKRLVVENDEQRFSADDCLTIHDQTGIPVLFDVFHHSCNNRGESMMEILPLIRKTWSTHDGIPMVDYSSQHPGKRIGSHADHIVPYDFKEFLDQSLPYDLDIMLEIKDKEESALIAVDIADNDPRFY
jgi:UV DNA damage endonuclease